MILLKILKISFNIEKRSCYLMVARLLLTKLFYKVCLFIYCLLWFLQNRLFLRYIGYFLGFLGVIRKKRDADIVDPDPRCIFLKKKEKWV